MVALYRIHNVYRMHELNATIFVTENAGTAHEHQHNMRITKVHQYKM